MRTLLATLAAVGAALLTTPADALILWNQIGGPTTAAVNSQFYGPPNTALDDQAADDFVVPAGNTWTVKRVRVRGQYQNGPGPAVSENVFFYTDAGGLPGTLVNQCLNLTGTTFGPPGNFIIPLGTSCWTTLPGGATGTRYWVSVQINMPFSPNGQWFWDNHNSVTGNPPAWQNPGNGFGIACPTWAVESTCISTATGDHRFRLEGN